MRTKQTIIKQRRENITQCRTNITRHLTGVRKIITFGFVIMLFTFVTISSVSAESFQSTEQVQFTFNSTISVNITGGDLVIESLTPGDGKDSNIITVTTSSNAAAGYNVYGSVGSDTITNTNLTHTNGSNTFTSINTTTALNNFQDNQWGYAYSTDSGSTWVSGNVGSTSVGYNGLPLYNGTDKTAGVLLASTTTPISSSFQFKIGAKAASTQIAGEYTNVINFIGITNPNPTYITLDEATYMQDNFSCTATPVGTVKKLIDSRDEQEYLVARAMDGNCWMIENLKIGKTLDSTTNTSITLTPTDSNVDDNFVMNYTDIPTDGVFHSYTIDDVPAQNNSNEWICHGGTDDWDSCYYNWYTATAGAGTTYVSTQYTNVETSICPAGWSLPTQPQSRDLALEYPYIDRIEVDNPTTTKNNSAGKIPGFLLSGIYDTGGGNNFGSYGIYWSRTAHSARRAYGLAMNTSNIYLGNYGGKYSGFAARCVKSS